MTQQQENKAIVTRFNKEFIEEGNLGVFWELVDINCINHVAPVGSDNGRDGMYYFLSEILRKGFPDITVNIFEQIAEGDLVTSRKEFYGTHTGIFMGIPPTQKKVVIKVIDIIRLKDGKYVDHWGLSNIDSMLGELRN